MRIIWNRCIYKVSRGDSKMCQSASGVVMLAWGSAMEGQLGLGGIEETAVTKPR